MHNIIYSLSSKPGSFGLKLYNYIFKNLNLNYIYKPAKVIEEDIMKNILFTLVHTDMISGLSISMPYKRFACDYLKKISNFTNTHDYYNSINTVKKIDSQIIKGCLTDTYILEEFYIKFISNKPLIKKVYVFGNGAMSYLTEKYLESYGYEIIKIKKDIIGEEINKINKKNDSCFVNATPILLDDLIPYNKINIPVLDFPVRINFLVDNDLILDGYSSTQIQFRHQFNFYTNKKLELEYIKKICKIIF